MGKFSVERFGIHNSNLVLFFLAMFLFTYGLASSQNDDVDEGSGSGHEQVSVGLVLDLGSVEGKMVRSSVSMALSDFYAINSDYKTRLSLSVRNSQGEPIRALTAAVDLLEAVGVEAIIGGNSLLEAKLLAELGEKFRVPVISLSSPVSFLLSKYSHLIQATYDSASEAKGIIAFIHGFAWNSVSLVFEDDDDWRESMQLLVDRFHESGVRIKAKVGFTVSLSEEIMMDQLQKLKDLGTSVFVVHLSELVVTHLFPCARKLGMMSEGFAWILTAKSMESFNENTDDFAKEAMEGVIGFKSYIPMTKELQNFTWRLKKYMHVEVTGGSKITKLSISSIWAHDVAWGLARAVEVIRMPNISSNLLEAIIECRFKGLNGNFKLDDKKLLSDQFEIVNMIEPGERRIGFWNSNGSFSNRRHLSSTHNKLETIIWPGGAGQSLIGSNQGESNMKKLRVLVTSSNKFPKLVKVVTNPLTNETTAEGFCIEVFLASIRPFNYEVEYIPWRNGSDYDNLAYALSSQREKYDAAIGDITITSNRSTYVDFTIPFTEMGLGIVALKETSMWVFFQPLTPRLWITSASFFVLTGIIVWFIERPENTEFQGSWSHQIGVILWFGFSTLVYAHRERLKHNLSRFVITVWVFSVLILTTSYTATLTSMMTVQQIRFNTDVVVTSSSLRAMRSVGLNSFEDYGKILLNRTVPFVVDELPYLKVLGENPAQFVMVDRQCSTNGFGFMFPKGTELVHHVSQEISKLRTDDSLNRIEKRWFENQIPYTTEDMSNPITLYRFRGLFMITGVSFAFAIAVLLILRLRDKWQVLVNSVNKFLLQRLLEVRIFFARTIHPSPFDNAIGENAVQMARRHR